jgi:hypothetical protein
MKLHQLLYAVIATSLVLPLTAGAEIYKWKDKDGVVRYSDTPPPSNIKHEPIGKKKVTSPAQNQTPASESDSQNAVPPVAVKKPVLKEAVDPSVEAARLRQRNAEIEKNNKQEKEAQAKLNEENCRAAKANHETYIQGGRVSKMNERGEREYLGDKELKEGAQKAQAEIDEYCN